MSIALFSENFYYGPNNFIVGNGWTSASGSSQNDGEWYRYGGRLVTTAAFPGGLLSRPGTETGKDVGWVISIIKAENLNAAGYFYTRVQVNGHCYGGAYFLDGSGNLTLTILKNTNTTTVLQTTTVSTGSYASLTFQFATIGTALTLIAQDYSTSTQIASITATDSTSELQVAGTFALGHSGITNWLTVAINAEAQSPLPAVTIATNNSNLYYSSGWLVSGSKAITNCTGQYIKFRVTNTTVVAVGIDVASVAGLSPLNYPKVGWSINGSPLQYWTLTANTDRIFLSYSLVPGTTYDITFYYLAPAVNGSNVAYERWVPSGESPPNALKVTGIYLNTGTLSTPNVKTGEVLDLGDSITESVLVDDPSSSWVAYNALSIGVEYSQSGFRGASWLVPIGSVPGLTTTWKYLWQGQLRTRAPQYVIINMGTNDQTATTGTIQEAVTSTLIAMRAFWSNAIIIVIVPFMYIKRDEIVAGFNASDIANKILVDLGVDGQEGMHADFTYSRWTFDGYHLTDKGHGRLGSLVASSITTKLNLRNGIGAFGSFGHRLLSPQ